MTLPFDYSPWKNDKNCLVMVARHLRSCVGFSGGSEPEEALVAPLWSLTGDHGTDEQALPFTRKLSDSQPGQEGTSWRWFTSQPSDASNAMARGKRMLFSRWMC